VDAEAAALARLPASGTCRPDGEQVSSLRRAVVGEVLFTFREVDTVPVMSRWTVHGERIAYDSPWVRVALVDVETPSGVRVPEHHVVRVEAGAAGCVLFDPGRDAVLLLWRHRFITDRWGYEVPAGRMEPGETPEQTAVRETVEETGWRPWDLRPLVSYHPSSGLSDQIFHTFAASGGEYVGDPRDHDESERVEWVPVPALIEAVAGELSDGFSLVALLTWLRTTGR
jgi:8-oxo-dGTP pyrophosphatase MutT (NUDIX family)